MALPQDVGGTIHLAQLPPFKPHSVISIPREVAGVASDAETEPVPLTRREAPGLPGEDFWGLQALHKPGLCPGHPVPSAHLVPCLEAFPALPCPAQAG